MKLICVSGGIGSGKSVVCQILSSLGVPVYNADERAKWLVNNNLMLRSSIIQLLGDKAYTADGNYNKRWVAAQVFNNPTLLQQLNALIHPCVYEDTKAWTKQNADSKYLIKEAALFKKARNGNNLDALVVVVSPEHLRIERIKKRDLQRSEQEIRDIMARQLSDEERIKDADFIIKNDQTQLLIPQVWSLHKKFME